MPKFIVPAKCLFWLLIGLIGSEAKALELPCWNKANCFSDDKYSKTDFGHFFVHRPSWHKELDDITLDMRRNRDYSILWNSSKDRIPIIHSEEANRAVEEVAGEVLSSTLFPLAYRIPLFVRIDGGKNRFNSHLGSAIPEFSGTVYSVRIRPKVDFSLANPVSLEAKLSNGGEIARFVLRIREAEISTPFFKNISIAGGYSFKDNDWHVRLVGKTTFPW